MDKMWIFISKNGEFAKKKSGIGGWVGDGVKRDWKGVSHAKMCAIYGFCMEIGKKTGCL
jgi:hypothetical protein